MKEKTKYSIWQNVRFMLRMAWENEKSVLIICIVYAALSVGINLVQLFLAPIILQKVERVEPIMDLLGTIGFFSIILLTLNGLLGYVDANVMYGRITVRAAIMQDINDKGCTTSYPNIQDEKVLKLQEEAKNICNENAAPGEHIWETLTKLLINITGFCIYLTLLSDLNFVLIIVIVITTMIGFFFSKWIHEWEYRHKEEKAQMHKELNYIRGKAESVQFAKDIRIFGLTQWINDMWGNVQKSAENFIYQREKVYAWNCIIDAAMQFARNGIAYFYLIWLVLDHNLPASEFLLYFSAFTGFSTWVTGILTEVTTLHKESLGLSLVQEYLNLPEKFLFEGGIAIPKTDTYELKMENVSFHYPGVKKDIISHMNLTIHSGEKIAVVGLNGAGKTTLVKLLCGFYDPDEGCVLLNGIDIRKFNRQEYYDKFSAVFQNMSVLDITVAENVAQTIDEIDFAKVEDCIEKAGLTEKILKLPQGVHTHVGRKVYLDGIEFSGGETQRLMLARALYKDGAILVLDEPTAALDPIAENDIYMKYSEMTDGKISIFVSHRLASTRFCDRILYIENGKIMEEGTHDSLMAMNGRYAKLFHVQARYYQEGREFDESEF